MDFSDTWFHILIGAVYAAPWVVAVILAVKMFRRSGGKAERSLLIGASFMLASSVFAAIVDALQPHLVIWLVEAGHDYSTSERALMSSIIGLVRGCITLAGISFLIYAFWIKFHAKT